MRVSRRELLVGAGSAAVVMGVALYPGVISAATQQVFYLDPLWGLGLPGCGNDPQSLGSGCQACNACHGHSSKLFISAALANISRAHLGCKCLVKSKAITERDYVSYFGPPAGPQHREQFDPRRDQAFLPDAPGLVKKTPTTTPAFGR
jgi:hypothetical protein